MNSYRAKYFDGIKPISQPVEVTIQNSVLKITQNGEVIDHWPLKLIYRDESHLSTIILACKGEQEARLELLEVELLQEFPLDHSLLKKKSFHINKQKLFFWIASIFVAILLAVLSIKPLTKIIAKNVSYELEHKLLNSAEEMLKPRFCTLGTEQNKSLNKILSAIYPQSKDDHKLPVQLRIVKDSQENAFVLPGATIWIHSGLIQNAQSAEEIAGVLAHEIEHIKQRHILESIVRGTLLTSFLNLLFGDVSSILIVDPQTALSILSLSFNREMESSADEGARQRLRLAGISTQGLIDFFERNSKMGLNVPHFLSTHPSDKERIQNLKKDITIEQNKSLLSEDEWQTLKSVCL